MSREGEAPSLPGELVWELTQEVTASRVSRWVPLDVVTGAAAWFAAGPRVLLALRSSSTTSSCAVSTSPPGWSKSDP